MLQNTWPQPAAEIALLADCPDCIPALAEWFRREWPDYYGGRSAGDVEQDFRAEANRHELPVRLVAFVGGSLAGTIVLRERALGTHPGHTPGLGGWYVAEALRGRGVGSALLRAGMAAAREFNHKQVFAATATAGPILERLGWQRIQTVLHGGEQVAVFRYTFTAG